MKIRNDECDYFPPQRRNLISPQWVSPSINIKISHLTGLFGGNETPFKDLCQRNKGKTVSKLMT